jgi:uncharacterized protein YbjQ (UPF0145 family)
MSGDAERDLPSEAIDRLRDMRGDRSGRGSLFTSDLSVAEFLLIDQAGFDPLGLVVGSSIYHVGIQTRRWFKNQELSRLTEAMYHARDLAMHRMEAEADQLDADGVVSVHLDIKFYGSGGLAEFIAIGTAVRPRSGESWRAPSGRPFTSDLSGQDFWMLLQTGYRPVSLVMGNCVYHVAHRSLGQALTNLGRNVELTNFTQGLYAARELAMARMQAEAERDEADGIVGVKVEEKDHVWGDHALEFLSIGTAIKRVGHPAPKVRPRFTISLDR